VLAASIAPQSARLPILLIPLARVAHKPGNLSFSPFGLFLNTFRCVLSGQRSSTHLCRSSQRRHPQLYVDGSPVATAQQYSQQAIQLANSPVEQPPPPMPPDSGQQAEWLPLGVWALAQEKNGDAYMFFQISNAAIS